MRATWGEHMSSLDRMVDDWHSGPGVPHASGVWQKSGQLGPTEAELAKARSTQFDPETEYKGSQFSQGQAIRRREGMPPLAYHLPQGTVSSGRQPYHGGF